jgi:hypothetical protein
LQRSGRDRASHKQTNHPVKFMQDTGVQAKIDEAADGARLRHKQGPLSRR